MTVVIHEFEIVADPTSPADQSQQNVQGGSEEKNAAQQLISPYEIERIIQRHSERLARICAY